MAPGKNKDRDKAESKKSKKDVAGSDSSSADEAVARATFRPLALARPSPVDTSAKLVRNIVVPQVRKPPACNSERQAATASLHVILILHALSSLLYPPEWSIH